MIEEYLKKIEANKEVLTLLPQNNAKNIKEYRAKVSKLLDEYNKDLDTLMKEITKRNKYFLNNQGNYDTSDIDLKISNTKDKIVYKNIFINSYELSNLDKLLYKLSHYYQGEIDNSNQVIKDIIDNFKLVGVNLTVEDFKYSYYVEVYMDKILDLVKHDYYLIEASKVFNDIYWKCPNLMLAITVNFKYLYYKYKKYFDIYYNKIIDDNKDIDLINEYISLNNNKNNNLNESRLYILNKYINGELNFNDYDSDKIEKLINEINNNGNITLDSISDYRNTLVEYKLYLGLEYLVNDLKKLYEKRNEYKGLVKKSFKEISKKESKVFGETKKIRKFVRKANLTKVDYFNNMLNNEVKELYDLYEELDKNLFLESVMKIDNSSTILDILSLCRYNYCYLIELFKTNSLEYDTEINKLDLLLYGFKHNIINNIFIEDKKDYSEIISDKYLLYGFNVNKEMVSDGNIDNLISKCDTIYNYIIMRNHKLDSKKIKFIKDSGEVINAYEIKKEEDLKKAEELKELEKEEPKKVRKTKVKEEKEEKEEVVNEEVKDLEETNEVNETDDIKDNTIVEDNNEETSEVEGTKENNINENEEDKEN